MDTNMTFRMDSEIKKQMSSICAQLGMTTSTAFNIFANAFVRSNGMPFAVTVKEPITFSRDRIMEDAAEILSEFSMDYKRMAE